MLPQAYPLGHKCSTYVCAQVDTKRKRKQKSKTQIKKQNPNKKAEYKQKNKTKRKQKEQNAVGATLIPSHSMFFVFFIVMISRAESLFRA